MFPLGADTNSAHCTGASWDHEKSKDYGVNAVLDLDRVYQALGFRSAPFRITPDTNFFFPHSQYLAALSHLQYGLMSGGITLLSGEVGLGKTLLCRCFMRQMARQNVRTAYVFNPQTTFSGLLGALYSDLTGMTVVPGTDEGTLHNLLYRALVDLAKQGTRVALIVDEAHALSPALLEGLRLLSNLETEERKLISLMLFGQNELEGTLALPSMRALKQRISVWHRLRPFGWIETAEYIQHRTNSARVMGDFHFTRSALLAVRHFSKGVPRRINQICDRAVLLAFARGKHRVDLGMLRQAAHEALGRAATVY